MSYWANEWVTSCTNDPMIQWTKSVCWVYMHVSPNDDVVGEPVSECDKLHRICQVGFAGAWHWPSSGRSDAYCDVFYVCACVCARVNGGLVLVYMMEVCLICVICVNKVLSVMAELAPFSPPAWERATEHRTDRTSGRPYVFATHSWSRVHKVNCN